jgi:hypothetical protein
MVELAPIQQERSNAVGLLTGRYYFLDTKNPSSHFVVLEVYWGRCPAHTFPLWTTTTEEVGVVKAAKIPGYWLWIHSENK